MNDPKLKRVVPIYVAKLLRETEQYDSLIDYAPVSSLTELFNKSQRTSPAWWATHCTMAISTTPSHTSRKLTVQRVAWDELGILPIG